MQIKSQSRSRARALQLLYAWETMQRPPIDRVVSALARLTGPEPTVLDLAERYLEGVTEQVERLDQLAAAAADHWRLDRLALVDRNILRLGIWELLQPHVPAAGAIDQAVWLAQRFGGAQSPAFVNGVLDRVARQLGRL
jgi:N utilization substance protein B